MYTFLWFWVSLLILFDLALGNTEIVNFSVVEDSSVELPFTATWPVLHPGASNIQFNTTSASLGSALPQTICASLDKWPQLCPHELWVVLDLDDMAWKSFDKFTLRVSWPAFHPTDISLKIYDPTALKSFERLYPDITSPKTRRKYARIQFVHTGVLTPRPNNVLDNVDRHTVSIYLVLEPLHFGFLPSSVIPVVLAIMAAIVIGLPVALKINNYFQSVIQKAEVVEEQKQKSSSFHQVSQQHGRRIT